MEKVKSLLDQFFNVEPIKCPHFAGDRACIICERMDSCTSIELIIEDFEDVKLLVAGNSAMLSFKLPLVTDIDHLMVAKLISSLEREQDLPIVKPEEGFDLTFYMAHGQVISLEHQQTAIMEVLDFLLGKPWVEVKMLVNNWIKATTEKIKHKVLRALPKVTLKKAPKVERSKIFEPKYKTLAEQPPQTVQEKVMEEPAHEITEPPITLTPPDSRQRIEKPEPSPVVSEDLIVRSKIPKQPFFLTAKENAYKFAMWPPNIKRKKPGEEDAITIEIPSVTEATKKVGPKKPTIDESHIPKGDQFELRIFEKKKADETPIPPMHTNDPVKILIYLEQLVKGDYEMRKLADFFDEGMKKIKKVMFYTSFLFEMSDIANILRKSEPGLAIRETERKDFLKSISGWKILLRKEMKKKGKL